jgi:hypothetical protein
MGKMTKAQKAEQEESRDHLRAMLKPGLEILCVLRHCSKSGMQRVIDLKVIVDGEIRGIGWSAAIAMGDRFDRNREGIVVGGCGMDMGFHLVYNLGATLWPKGTEKPHGTRNGEPDTSGGYALKSRWI